MKKILALSTSYPIRNESVSGIFVHNLYKAMADSWSIEVLCPDDERQSGGIIEGIKVTPVRYAPKWMQVLGGAGGILPSLQTNPLRLLLLPLLLISMFAYTLVRARSATVIHANWAICGVVAVIAGKIAGKKVVLTLRGSDVEKSRSSAVFKWQLQMALAGADFIVCVSESMKNDLLRAYPNYADKISYCHNGISEAFFDSTSSPRHFNAPLRVLAVGSLIPVKGFDLLLQAFQRASDCNSLHLTIVGEGPQRAVLEALIERYGMQSQVTLAGQLPYADMPEIMASSDLFVLSSHAEGRPNVVAEAVASGLPVISADLPGVRDLVIDGENGWLFEAGNVSTLAMRLSRALEGKDELQAMGACGRKRIRAHSQWSAAAYFYSNLFDTLIGSDAK